MIIGASFVLLQTRYLKEYDYGFNKERLFISKLSLPAYANKQTFEAELRQNPFIEEVSYSTSYLGKMNMPIRSENESKDMSLYLCSANFPALVGLSLVEGRFFRETDMEVTDGKIAVMLNKAAANFLNVSSGDEVAGIGAGVIGIVEDFKFTSLHSEIRPIIIMGANPSIPYPPNIASIRVKPGIKRSELTKLISSAMLKADPVVDPSSIHINTIDESIDGLYQDEDDIALMISVFALASIIISLLGVFGMVMLEAQHSRREVAVRKIFGSSVFEILLRFNTQIMITLLISTVIAIPLAWLAIDNWLSSYPYRVPMYWWVFPLGALIVFIIVSAW